ncbi:hypothetical protein ACFUC1_06920 [Pedococcus sp. NPDC057267]|uniref:hypothetical protein n=1 Tax=Pedococcus sp. NPDC057267 TaxID=3346077 RepID=UPI00363A52CF
MLYLLFCLGCAPLLNDSKAAALSSEVWGLSALWVIASCMGGVASARPKAPVADDGEAVALTPALIVSSVSLFATIVLIRAGTYGLTGQLAGQSSGGVIGLLSAVGPAFAAGALISAFSGAKASRPKVGRYFSLGLVGCHCILLTLSGFRGAAPFYLIAIVITGSEIRDRFRRATSQTAARRLVTLGFVGVIIAGFFLAGAAVRSQVVAASGTSAAPQSLRSVISRFDSTVPLSVAWQHRSDESAREAVGIPQQVIAVIPRVLYPEKPVIDYGQRLAVLLYGLPADTRSSETVTAFGDAILAAGLGAAFLIAVAYTAAFDSLFRFLRSRTSVLGLIIAVNLALSMMSIEGTFVLNVVSVLRTTLTIVVVYYATGWITGGAGSRRRDASLKALKKNIAAKL